MNVFILDLDPVAAAAAHCDAHVVKMPTESAQMLSTVLRRAGADDPALYRATHERHPCTLWAGATRANFRWLVRLALGLVDEHGRRYGHTLAGRRGHAARAVVERAADLERLVPEGSLTPFAQAMPDVYRGPDPVAAYRAFYRGEKAAFAAWRSPAVVPAWWS